MRPWRNWSGSQEHYPDRVERPASLAELQGIVREVAERSGTLKPVATGLSFADVTHTDDTLVELVGLRGQPDTGALLPLEAELWKRPSLEPRVRLPCGARIRQLNQALARAGLGFTNLGGYDGQTMIGALSTSTHGSGVTLGPLCDGVRSLDLVTQTGSLLRIEPSAGITDVDKFKRRYGTNMALIQDDAWFWPCVVSLGCMGIVYAVTMAVSPAYRLKERRHFRRWSDVARELGGSCSPLRTFRNYEVLLNPYRRRDGDHDCLVVERNVAPPDAEHRPQSDAQRSAESITFLASTQREVLRAMIREPRLIPGMLRAGFEALETVREPRVDHSYIVYNVGHINTARVISGEYFFPLAGGRFLRAVWALLDLVRRNVAEGIYQPSPLALRFVAGSRAPLSMVRGEPHGAVEIAYFSQMPGGPEALLRYERLCLELEGRPHWGQMHELTGTPGWLAKAYPHLDSWLRRYYELNASGTFNNHFTDRLRISVS